MLNLVCRDTVLRNSVLERVQSEFPSVLSRKIEGEVNEVLLCSHGKNEMLDASHITPPFLTQAAKHLQSALSSNRTENSPAPHIDIAELLKGLKVA